MDTMLNEQFCLHPVHDDERATVSAMKDSRISLMPTHCINPENQLEGFMQTVSALDTSDLLCVNRTMFFGHSLFECLGDEASLKRDFIRLMSSENNSVVQSFLEEVDKRSVGLEASFECAPENADLFNGSCRSKVSYARGKRSVDSRRWAAEVPQRIGLYHALVRGYQKDVRQHKLFIVVSGGCSKCSDSFYNLMLDVGKEWSALDAVNSEEVWWLRKACQRSRCRLASMFARRFELRIEEQLDVQSYDQEYIGVPLTDTVEFDFDKVNDMVTLYNACSVTRSMNNGALCQMNPTEGYWVFKGNQRSSVRNTSFGSLVGLRSEVFPTRSTNYVAGMGNKSFVQGADQGSVVRLKSKKRTKANDNVFQCFDEVFMKHLETMGWNRDHGVVELVPVVVGCY